MKRIEKHGKRCLLKGHFGLWPLFLGLDVHLDDQLAGGEDTLLLGEEG